MLNKEQILEIFKKRGALLHGHFVYTNRHHGNIYVNKDAIYPYPDIHKLCEALMMKFGVPVLSGAEAVVAPALGGIVLSRMMADHLMKWRGGGEVLAVYAEKDGKNSVFKRGYDKLIKNKKVLLVDDVATTGGTIKELKNITIAAGAEILGIAVLWNRGDITKDDLGIKYFYSLIKESFDSWQEKNCPLCKQGVPVHQGVGKGRDFMLKQMEKDVVKAANMAVAKIFKGDKK